MVFNATVCSVKGVVLRVAREPARYPWRSYVEGVFSPLWTGKGGAHIQICTAAGHETATIGCSGCTREPRRESTPLVNISPSPSPSPQPAPILWHAIPSPQLHRYFFSVPFFFFMSSHHVHFLHHIGAARTPQHGRLPLALHRSILYNAQRHQPERHSRTQCMCRDHGLGIIHPPTVSMHQR